MNQLSEQQTIQEGRYRFPYHYVPTWDGRRFSQAVTMRWGYEYLAYSRFVQDLAFDIGFESLVDVGCGDGRFLFDVWKRAPDKALVGIDYSQRAIALAKAMAPEVDWLCEDICRDDVVKCESDLVTAIETLEHIPPDELPDFVQAIGRLVKPCGKVIVTVPSSNLPVAPKHYQHFDAATLQAVMSPSFRIDATHYINRNGGRRLRSLEWLLCNRFFLLNHTPTLRLIFRYYCRHVLPAREHTCRRIVLVCSPGTR